MSENHDDMSAYTNIQYIYLAKTEPYLCVAKDAPPQPS